MVIGSIPGLGAAVSAFLNYGLARSLSRRPERFGDGAIEGVAAAETGNNAVTSATFVPLLTLGVPGDVITAIMLGAFVVHGLVPGPALFEQNTDFIAAFFVLVVVGTAMHLVIARLGMPLFVQTIRVPNQVLFPIVMVLSVTGVYVTTNSYFDVYAMLGFGVPRLCNEQVRLSRRAAADRLHPRSPAGGGAAPGSDSVPGQRRHLLHPAHLRSLPDAGRPHHRHRRLAGIPWPDHRSLRSMKIDRIDILPVRLPLKAVVTLSRGVSRTIEEGKQLVLVKLTGEDGTVGWGEAGPSRRWSAETVHSCYTTLKHTLAPVVVGRDAFDVGGLHEAMNAELAPGLDPGQPIAKAAVDLALHDLVCKRLGINLQSWIGSKRRDRVDLAYLVSAPDPEATRKTVQEGLDQGFRSFKLKVGHEVDHDVANMKAALETAPGCIVWPDANQGYSWIGRSGRPGPSRAWASRCSSSPSP